MNLVAQYTPSISGEVMCPGDKSISQRAVIIGSLLNEDIEISGFLNGEDPISTANALNAIGSSIKINGTSVSISSFRSEPIITALWEIDLSPGHKTSPEIEGVYCASKFKTYLLYIF